ncbi:hypothetical protein [Saccharothrix sp. HUAS TT1]|uniref:hypothetical protein n=1 Tax=unclassified Saccharothrix TaxID=2593673 RepID=UPI00345C07C3
MGPHFGWNFTPGGHRLTVVSLWSAHLRDHLVPRRRLDQLLFADLRSSYGR